MEALLGCVETEICPLQLYETTFSTRELREGARIVGGYKSKACCSKWLRKARKLKQNKKQNKKEKGKTKKKKERKEKTSLPV